MHKGCMNFEHCKAADRSTSLEVNTENCPFCGGVVRLFIYTFADCKASGEMIPYCGFCGDCLTSLTTPEKQQHLFPHIELRRKRKYLSKRDKGDLGQMKLAGI